MLDKLKQILFMAIVGIGICVGQTEVMGAAPAPAPVLDFNGILAGNVPASFLPKIYRHTVPAPPNHVAPQNMPAIDCIYFAIPHQAVIANQPFNVPNNPTVPSNTDHNIYFPRNGVQPTTPEAVAWSCANIDNREDSPITEWYMKMFGVIPFQNTGNPANDYIKAGWSAPGAGGAINAQRIISYSFMETLAANLRRLAILYGTLPVAAPPPPIPTLAGTQLAAITSAQILIKDKKSIAQLIVDLENILLAAMAAAPGVAATQAVVGLGAAMAGNQFVIAVQNAAIGHGWVPSNILSAVSYARRVADNSRRAIPVAPAAITAACTNVAGAALTAVRQAENIFLILQSVEFLLKQMCSDGTVNTFANKLEESFKKNFRKIASTSVGRTLLYRILIEIRRHHAAGNTGILENGILHGGLINERNSLRRITIDFGNYSFNFNGKILIDSYPTATSYVIGNATGTGIAGRYDHVIRHKSCKDISLFHEMNHWYHALRHISRIFNETNGRINIRHFDGTARNGNHVVVAGNVAPPGSEVVGSYYWNPPHGVNVDEMLTSEKMWGINSRANYEEIRNILGVPVNVAGAQPVQNTENGDDLSENLYRMCIGMPLRVGHVYNGFGFYEDSRVIDRIINSCSMQRANYNCIAKAEGRTEVTYGSRVKGIGSGEF